MRISRLVAPLVLGFLAVNVVHAADSDFRPLFNGKDLSGWVPVNVAPGTFSVRDGIIVSTGKPSGFMRSERPYENFVLELEWRHLQPGGNAGVFVWGDALPAVGTPFARGIEVQILDGRETANYTSHGDVFAIQGATMTPDRAHPAGWMRCLPSEKRAKPSPEWNHYRITCKDGVIKLAVNGKEVSGGRECHPKKGYICLESEGSECHFRNIRVQELPSSNATTADTATLDEGFTSLYSGIDLYGWKQVAGNEGHWTPKGHILAYDGKSEAAQKDLWTEKSYGDFVLMADWRFPNKSMTRPRAVILPSGDDAKNDDGTVKTLKIPYNGDSGILPRGSVKAQVNLTSNTVGSGELYGYRTDKKMPAEVRAGAIPKTKADKPHREWNRMIVKVKGDRMTVTLNGQLVIDNVPLPGLPPSGPIGLQHHGDPVEFTNLFIKALD